MHMHIHMHMHTLTDNGNAAPSPLSNPLPLLGARVVRHMLSRAARRELREAGFHAGFLSRKVGFELYELVEGEYSATELRDANYDSIELKEVGFTAKALRMAGFTSKQLHAARYRLREMQEGGVPWQDLGACSKRTKVPAMLTLAFRHARGRGLHVSVAQTNGLLPRYLLSLQPPT